MGAARWLKRLALVPLGVALGLLALEALLQVAALAVHLGGGPTPAAWLTGNRRVLCLGDSNTYGLYLPDRAQAYPQTFEALWNERVASPRIEVLNLGYPGTNSSRLRRDLPRMLEAFAPDVVILMVGSNDYWTAPVDIAPSGAFARAAQSVKRHSRVYQLSYMLRRALVGRSAGDRLRSARQRWRRGHRALRRRRDSRWATKRRRTRRCAIARSSRPICVRDRRDPRLRRDAGADDVSRRACGTTARRARCSARSRNPPARGWSMRRRTSRSRVRPSRARPSSTPITTRPRAGIASWPRRCCAS